MFRIDFAGNCTRQFNQYLKQHKCTDITYYLTNKKNNKNITSWRKTDNTMVKKKIKTTKGKTKVYKTLHRNPKTEQHEHPPRNPGLRCSGRVS